jgi:hypothetical protein
MLHGIIINFNVLGDQIVLRDFKLESMKMAEDT